MIKDPICGMELAENMVHSSLTFKGKEYYFDSESCETLFRKLNNIELPAGGESAIAGTEKKMIAYNTLKQLAVTIAHYIRNANTAISAQAQLSVEASDPKALHKSAAIIKHESEKIEAVVSALLSLSDIKPQKYVDNEEESIMDLRNSLEDKIREGEQYGPRI